MLMLHQCAVLELVELREHERRVTDGIHTYVIPAAVRNPSAKAELHPYETAVRRADRKPCRLGNHGCVSTHASLQQCAGAEALVLLVGNACHDYLALEPGA